MSYIYVPKVFLTYSINKEFKKENDMGIKKSLLNFITDGVVTCKQLSDFYDYYHENKEFSDAINFLSGSVVIDMSQLKKELYASEDAHVLGVIEYMQKYYPSAISLIDLIPKEKRRFVH